MKTLKWDTELMKRSVLAISSFTSQQRDYLLFIAAQTEKAQDCGDLAPADILADEFFELFGAWLIGDQSLMHSLSKGGAS
jgi:hypothetical protein